MYNKIILADGEEIRHIYGYKGLYSVTNKGRVYGHIRNRWLKGSTRGGKRDQKYIRVDLRGKHISVHKLVADAFIGKVKGKDIINHIDGNPMNNNVSNLEWCTHSENFIHATRLGLRENIHQSKLSIDQMSEICEAFATGLFSMREIGRYFKVSHSTIGGIINNKTHNKRVA